MRFQSQASKVITSNAIPIDYTLNNPDTLTKYKTAAQISHKVLEAVSGMTFCLKKLPFLPFTLP